MSGQARRVLLICGLAMAIGVVIAVTPGHRGWFDIGVYHGAVNYWVHSGGDLYSYLRPGSTYGFTYPPFAAVCMLPMSLVGWHPAIAINLAFTIAASALLLGFLVDPIARRHGWSRWYAFALAACAFAALNPVRDTVSFGQINLLLVALVYLDLWLLDRRSGLVGAGIGLAAAVKLTPAIFILYLLVTRRWRAAGTAAGTAAAATLLAAAVAPDASRTYFTQALWDTGRIGVLDYISNQSLMGMVARLHPQAPDRLLWLGLVGVAMVVWLYRAGAAARLGDDHAGFALTGLASCLVSPITWVHHLVWLVPGLIVVADAALPWKAAGARVRRRLRAGVAAYALLVGSVVWLWSRDYSGLGGFLGGNSYVLISLGMLVFLPLRDRTGLPSPDAFRPGRAPGLPPGREAHPSASCTARNPRTAAPQL